MTRRFALPARLTAAVVASALVGLMVVVTAGPAVADSYVPISGAGSTWSENAINQWIADVQQYGMQVNYAGTGSSDGRSEFLDGTVDYAASDIPFQSHPTDGSQPEDPAPGSYAYIPITAGGTAFMYNLTINGQRVTDLRLSGQNIAKIFTAQITNWDDPAIAADNPQLTLPNESIVPVVRSDGSGSSFQFSAWMIAQYPAEWTALCNASGRAPACGPSSYWPTTGNMIAQSGDLGVAGYVDAGYAAGAIGYVNYSYALEAHFPVAEMLNAAGYYTEPTPDNVAVSLLQAQVDTTDVNDPSLYLTQQLQNVYTDTDPHAYPLSSYSYLILPTTVQGQFSTAKGKTLAAFSYYAMCQGQQESASLGYSPMPYNLVQDTFTQIQKIPGEAVPSFNLASCNNPTIDPSNPSDANYIATTAPQPAACAKQGSTQCAAGTAGDQNATTLNSGSSPGSDSSTTTTAGSGSSGATSSSGSSTGSTSTGGTSTGGTSTGGTSTGGTSTGGTSTGGTSTGGTSTGGTSTGGTSTGGTSTGGASTGGTSNSGGSAACDPSQGNCSAASAGGVGPAAGSSGRGSVSAGGNRGTSGAGGALTNTGGDSGDPSASDPSNSSTALAASTTTTLPAKKGWTGITMALLIALLTVGVVLAPGATSLYLARHRE